MVPLAPVIRRLFEAETAAKPDWNSPVYRPKSIGPKRIQPDDILADLELPRNLRLQLLSRRGGIFRNLYFRRVPHCGGNAPFNRCDRWRWTIVLVNEIANEIKGDCTKLPAAFEDLRRLARRVKRAKGETRWHSLNAHGIVRMLDLLEVALTKGDLATAVALAFHAGLSAQAMYLRCFEGAVERVWKAERMRRVKRAETKETKKARVIALYREAERAANGRFKKTNTYVKISKALGISVRQVQRYLKDAVDTVE